ncbi:hypothetical protein ACM40_15735 [Chryseobacterium sp. BLS98]|uniref:DUF6265 family protein n=1 Tax=Chryseobacterium sp. BLS98 TaxID=885586 RepID=UPI00065AA19F|nr:DUF6265 family protein [Chryseobacterium sp. BLS98]KMQ61145.1 hypothetical protein ACM40_15735 [Chryseobacterium sp. BLS98]
MRTGAKFFITVVGLIIFNAWTIKQKKDIQKAEWLVGTWENKTQKGSIYESWTKADNNELSGKSYSMRGKDTIVFENIRLVQENKKLFYIPTVKNQNEGLPVRFVAKAISENQLVFENPQHDFPQIIAYTKITSDSLIAEISGTKNGQKREQTFPMKRVKR